MATGSLEFRNLVFDLTGPLGAGNNLSLRRISLAQGAPVNEEIFYATRG